MMSATPLAITYSGDINQADINITIDSCPVDFLISDNCISIAAPDNFGFHLLKITSLSNKRFNIETVLVDGADLRKLLYLSWICNSDGTRMQPATECWEAGQVWILPYGNPLSFWISTAEKKITNDLYGKNLDDHYWIYYPDTIELSQHLFPDVLTDFFKYNFDFTAVPKSSEPDLLPIPYMEYSKDIPKILLNSVLKEFVDNRDYIEEHKSSYGQHSGNKKEFGDKLTGTEWVLFWLHHRLASDDKKALYQTHLDLFPATKELLTFLNHKYWSVFIGIVPPGGFIYPHSDNVHTVRADYEEFQGCTQLYIPLQWADGNYIKFAGAGSPNLSNGPMVINNDRFTHAVVNDSTQDRYILAIRCDKSIEKNCTISGTNK